MSTDLKSIALTSFAAIIAAQTSSVVDVVVGSNTASGLLTNKAQSSDLEDAGEVGLITGSVYCKVDDVGTVNRGGEITVDGHSAFVMDTTTDPAGALIKIDYQYTETTTTTAEL